jgi:DNA replication protein DnaC
MDRLPEVAAKTREALCPEHGAYESHNIIRHIWSGCPACKEQERKTEEALRKAEIAKEAARRHAAWLDGAAIPKRFIGRTFDNFVAEGEGQRRALAVARDYAENFSECCRKGAGLILAGMPGTGKSHLAAAILQSMPSADVRYTTCLDVIRGVRETWRRDSEQSERQLLRYLEGLDLLVIDEVGVQYGTDGEQTILFDVLDRRYREVKPTVLLTNQDKAGFASFIGERSFDRLIETSRWVAFDWPSYRPTARREAA